MNLRRACAAVGVLPLLLAGCTSETAQPRSAPVEVNVDVDTPQLRAAKEAAGVADCRPGDAPPVEQGLPDVTLPCLGGGPDVNLSSLRGPLVLNLWAQWCGPCRAELPYYQKLHEQLGDRLQVVGIDYQDPLPGRALELIEETGVTFPLLADPEAQVRAPFRVRGLPILVLVDEEGRVVHREYVAIESYDQLRDIVGKHLDVTV